MSRRPLRWLSALVMIALLVAGCGSPGNAADSDEIKIAVVGPMTGDAAQYGEDFTRGAQLAAEQINAADGVDGKQITIVTFDDRNDTTEAASVAQKIATDSSIVASMGHFTSSTVYAAMPIYKSNQLPLVVISASDPGITEQGNEWVFRVSPTNNLGAEAMADLIVNELGLKKIAIFYLNTDFGKTERQFFTARVAANGGEIVLDEPYQPDAKDFSSSIIKLKNAGADAVYLSSYYNDAVLLIRQAKDAGVETRWFTSAAVLSPQFTEIGGEAVEGVITNRVSQGDSWDAVAEAYRAKYNDEPSPFVIYAYSAVQAIAEAAKSEGTSREAIREGLAKIQGLETALGPLTFDENRQAVYESFDYLEVRDGQFQLWQP